MQARDGHFPWCEGIVTDSEECKRHSAAVDGTLARLEKLAVRIKVSPCSRGILCDDAGVFADAPLGHDHESLRLNAAVGEVGTFQQRKKVI
jgi:hypothetical protein